MAVSLASMARSWPYCIIDEKILRSHCLFFGYCICNYWAFRLLFPYFLRKSRFTWMSANPWDIVKFLRKNGVRRDKHLGGSRYLSQYGWAVAMSDAESWKKTCAFRERGLPLRCQKTKKLTKNIRLWQQLYFSAQSSSPPSHWDSAPCSWSIIEIWFALTENQKWQAKRI